MRAKHVFGLTPWGRFFMEAMEALADDGRLARGRSYAGNGAVLELTVSGGLVKAKVAGNYAPFYRVSIGFAPFSEKAAAAVRAEFASDPLLRARIASGVLPAGLVERLAKAGASLVPRKWSEITRSCSCPDDGDPCKHQAAVYYLLAQEIDRDPFVLFRLRGVDSDALAEPAAKSAEKVKPARTAVKPIDFLIPGHLLPTLVEPWPEPQGSGDPLAGVGPLSAYVAAIPAMLPPSRGLAPFDLRVAITAFYHRAASRGTELLAAPASAAMSGASQRTFARSRFDIIFWPDGSAFIYSPLFPKDGNLEPLEASRLFAACDESDGSTSYRFLRAFFRAVRSMVSAGAFVPDIMVADGSLSAYWKPARLFSDVQALLAALEPAVPAPAGYDDGGFVPDPRSTIELLSVAFFSSLAAALRFSLPAVRENDHPIARVLFRPIAVPCDLPGSRALPGALHAWLSVYDMAAKRLPLELKVAAAKAPAKAAAKADAAKTGATVSKLSYRLSAAVVGEDGSRVALCKAAASAGEALAFAALLSNFVPALARLGVDPWAELGEKELADFIVDAAPLLVRFGVRLVLPKELKRLATPRPALRATRKASFVTYLDMATAFSFDWTVAIGDERLTPAEFSALVGSGLALVRWRNEWVRIDPAEAARVLARVSGRKAPGAMEALRTALAGDVELDGELSEAVEFLVGSGRREADDAPVPASLCATLRPYQERGYRWMLGNFDRGLGCLLADDMGLGKTVQTIAAMLALKEAGRLSDCALVCAPASLLTNWEQELARFAPSLRVGLYYGSSRKLALRDLDTRPEKA